MSDSVPCSYHYSLLQSNSDHIRLIALAPARDPRAELRCEIEHIVLADTSPTRTTKAREDTLPTASLSRARRSYEAVSYTWGEPIFSETLFCDDKVLHITRNLDGALRRFRLKDDKRYLWVDAVCINQSDLEERSRQVMIMERIYSGASDVLVWLGEDSAEHSDGWISLGLFTMLNRQHDLISAPGRRAALWHEHLKAIMEIILQEMTKDSRRRHDSSEPGTRILGPEEMLRREQELQDIERLWNAVRIFFSRPWFKRRWVVQEVILARHATFYCGEASIDSFSFVKAVSWLRSPQIKPVNLDDEILESLMQMQPMMWPLNQHIKSRPAWDILELLNIFQTFDCTDDRDRIFALLALLREGPAKKEFFFEVDYRNSTATIFSRLAKQLILDRNSLGVLSYAGAMGRSSESKVSLQLPSWVPDWRLRTKYKPLPLPIKSSLSPPKEYDLDVNDLTDALRIRGVEFDIIASARSRSPTDDSDRDRGPEHVLDEWMAICDIYSSHNRYVTGGPDPADTSPYFPCVAQTLTANRAHETVGQAASLEFVFSSMFGNREQWILDATRPTTTSSEVARPSHTVRDDSNGVLLQTWDLEEFAQGEERLSFPELVAVTMKGRAFCVTRRGYIGIGPADTRVGDVISVLYDGDMSFILRPQMDSFMLVGDCYIHDLMAESASWMTPQRQRDFLII